MAAELLSIVYTAFSRIREGKTTRKEELESEVAGFTSL
jgi:hypothetical protein